MKDKKCSVALPLANTKNLQAASVIQTGLTQQGASCAKLLRPLLSPAGASPSIGLHPVTVRSDNVSLQTAMM